MKNPLKRLIALAFVVVIALTSWSIFHVSGNEIAHIAEIDGDCTITVSSYQHMDWENRAEQVLNAAKNDALRQLFLDSDFTRALSSSVTFDDLDQFDIFVDFNDRQNYLSVHVIGNEYILVTDQFGGRHLKIGNPDFKARLQEILQN